MQQPLQINRVACAKNNVLNQLKASFPNVFASGLGRFTGYRASFEVKPEAVPIYCPKRTVPIGAKDIINRELDRLLALEAIKPIKFSNWAAPIVVVKKKNGKARVCADFSTGLNTAIELCRHPLPNPNHVYDTLSGAKCFSVIDLADAYLQVELDDASRKMAVINTHRGLFEYQRLPFGVNSAPGIFQGIMDQLLGGIKGVQPYLDDVIIASKSTEEHMATINKVFKQFDQHGI